MSAKKTLLAIVFLAIAAWAADAILQTFFARDADFQRAEQILQDDSRFQNVFGVDAVLEPVKKTVVNRSTPEQSYVQLDFQAKSGSKSSSSRVVVRIYGGEDPSPRHDVEFR